jgi:hypothetical protein
MQAAAPEKEELRNTLKARAENPQQKKLKGGVYLPFYGVTCVMALSSDEKYQSWAKQLYTALAADPVVTTGMALLPPESYHVTLRGLEAALEGQGPEQTSRLYDDYARVQKLLYEVCHGAPPITMKVKRSGPGRFDMECGAMTEKLLRSMEGLVVQELLARDAPDETKHQQAWHLTLSYAVDGGRKSDSFLAAQKKVDEIVRRLGAPGDLVFDPPRICTYSSMQRFDPLFPLPSSTLKGKK